MTFAVVPAAGHSTRMGRPKLSLPLAGRSVIEHAVAALREGGCQHVVAVIGPHVPELVPLAAAAGAHVRLLTEPTADMRETVEFGLRWLATQYHPKPDDAWVLSPGDHPTLDAGVVRILLAEYERGGHSVVVPTCAGRRGHPTVVAWRHVDGIRSLPAGQGLNAYLRTLAAETRELPVADEGVLCDLDTPADYERLRARFGP
jgi:CTP:molybdopterin cytidylyltransferase MocA